MLNAVIVTVLAALGIAQAQTATPSCETLFYTHDGLNLETYLYVPYGDGPFPMVVYNHGSAEPGKERDEWPAPFIARVLVPAGYAVLVPERRGYGKSEGKTFAEDIGADRGPRFVERQRAEAGDINAAADFVLSQTNSKIDRRRIVNMGFSFGGIVTTLSSASVGSRYAGVILQAPGALNWPRSAEMRAALIEAAQKIRVPMLCSVAENDRTTENATALCAAAAAAGSSTAVKIYPSVTKQPATAPLAPSDQFFDSGGVRLRYVEQGSGSPIVLMHGYTGTADRHFIANGVFATLAKDHRVIAVDLRGHGKSGKPHDPSSYGDEMARDVVRLLDHLKIQRAHVLGYSLGAMIAGRLATMHPERLLTVSYIGSLPLRTTDSYMDKFAAASVQELEGDLPFKSLMVNLQAPGSKPPSDDEVRKAVAPLVAANDVKALAALWRGYKSLAVSAEQLEAVKVPSIVIVGSEDSSAAGVPDLNRTQPQIRTLVVRGAQHGGPEGVMRRPEFMTTLREFLAAAK